MVQGYSLARHGTSYPQPLRIVDPSRAASQDAIRCIPPHDGAVLSTATLIPQLSERVTIRLAEPLQPSRNLPEFDYILLNYDRPGYFTEDNVSGINAQRTFLDKMRREITASALFEKHLDRDGVEFWSKRNQPLLCGTEENRNREMP